MLIQDKRDYLLAGLLGTAPVFFLVDSMLVGAGMGFLLGLFLILNFIILFSMRSLFPSLLRLTVVLLLNATLVLVFGNLLQVYFYPFFENIGLFFPLIAINSLVLAYAESLFNQTSLKLALSETLFLILFFVLLLTLFGAAREILNSFTLFSDLGLFTGKPFSGFHLFDSKPGLSIFAMPAGVFFLLGIFCALINLLYKNNHVEKTYQGVN